MPPELFAILYVPTVTPMPSNNKMIPIIIKLIPRPLAKSGPTDETLRQCGHLAKALFNKLN